jgi:thioredoxin
MRKKLFLSLVISSLFFITCKSENKTGGAVTKEGNEPVVQLTNESFKKLVFNYEANKTWAYEGTKPAIVDFYATWCGPCKQLSPIVEELAREYAGKVVFYKVDTDKENALAQSLGITGLPTLLFIPAQGTPQMSMGLLPKENLVKAINEVLMVK